MSHPLLEWATDIFVVLHAQIIDPLPPLDHSEIDYVKFNKNFYEEHEDIRNLLYPQIQDLREKLGIRVSSGIHC